MENTWGNVPKVNYWIVSQERQKAAMFGHVAPGYPGKMWLGSLVSGLAHATKEVWSIWAGLVSGG